MRLTKTALGLLNNQYRSVLKKCFLINMGVLAFSAMAEAATTVTTYDDLLSALGSADADVVLNMSGAGIDLDGGNGFTIGASQTVGLENIGTQGSSSWTDTAYNISNSGTLSIDSVIFKQNETVTTGVSYIGGILRNNASGHIIKIVDSVFDTNRAETTTTTLWGGVVFNDGGEIDLVQNVTFKDNFAYAGQNAPHGGAFLNQGHIGIMDNVIFENNTMTGAPDMIGGAHGTALDNNEGGTIDKITNSVFRNNYVYRTGEAVLSGNYHASAAALDNYQYIGEISNTLFEGNHTSTESPSASATAGAAMNILASDLEGWGVIGKIENVQFINNYAYAQKASAGGGAFVTGRGGEFIKEAYVGYLKDVLFQGNYARSDGSYALGGAAALDGYVGYIEGSFYDNCAYSTGSYVIGGAIRNVDVTINSLSGTFERNYAFSSASYAAGGAIYNQKGTRIGDMTDVVFKDNYVKSTAADAYSGAIHMNSATVNSISGQFSSNYADAVGTASAGGLNNNAYAIITNGISANFEDNYAKSTGVSGLARGGAVLNFGYIKNILGNFKSNYGISSGKGVIGGAIANMYGNIGSLGIDELRGAYEGNYAEATGTGYAQGGAIYNGANAKLNLINASEFKGNYVKSGSNSETNGGAIWNAGSLVFGGENSFIGNYKEVDGVKSYNDVYNSGTITFNADSKTTFNGSFEGGNGTVSIGNAAELNLGNKLSGQRVSFVNAAKVNLESYEPEGEAKSYGGLNLISLTSGSGKVTLNAVNDEFQALKFGDTSLGSALDYQLDVDAVSEKADTIEAKALTAGTVNISDIRFKDNFEDVTGIIQVLKNTDTSTLLKLTLDPQFVHDYGEGVVVETIGADALTSGDIVWNGDYGTYTLTTTTTATFDVATTDTDDDSIGYVANIKKEKTYNPRENLSMINQNEDYSEKSFNFETAEDVYDSGADIGTTYGRLTVNGVADEEGKRSTIDLNGYQGFSIGDGREVIINNSVLTNSGNDSLIEIGEGGRLAFQNATLEKISINNDGELSIDNNRIDAKVAQFGSGSALDLAVNSLSDHGLFTAETITIDEGAKLHAVLAQGIVGIGETADIELLRASNSNFNKFTDVFENNMYKFEKKDLNGWYTIKQVKTAEDVAKESGGTKTNEEAAAAWVDGPAFSGGSAVADGLTALAQNDGRGLNKELTALAPNDAPVVQGVSAQIHDILLKRVSYQLRHGTSAEGISSGDEGKGVSLWAEGYGGKSKLQRRGDHYGFSTDSKGVIIGLDKKIGSAIKIGAGFQYDDTEVDGYRRDTDVDTETVFAYGEYKPNQWFARGLLSYSMSDYNEKKRVLGNSYRADYSADTYSAQAISGYDMGYVTPLGGLKYYHIKRHGYEDGLGQKVSGKDMDILTAVGGVRLAKEYTLACGHSIKPEAYLGVSYDLKSDRDNAVVGVANGASYTVHGKRLPRFGVEFNAGLTAELTDRLSANVNYLGAYRDDYQDHTGLIGLKYSF